MLNNLIEIFNSFILGIIEGITEWLPISSTGHLILVNEFIGNNGFTASDLYIYVIQLGAILAVVTLYFKKLNPFALSKTKAEKSETWQMWFKVIVACIPAAVIGLLLNDFMEHFENAYVVSSMLIIYGIGFIIAERNKKRIAKIDNMNDMTYKTAFLIGMFQVLSIIPGTSRSGATILGAIILGCSREIAAEFSFFLAIPVMFGVSILKILSNGLGMSGSDALVLILGMAVSYIVSMISIKFLTNYVKKHSFEVFGYYRIILGIIVIGYFLIFG